VKYQAANCERLTADSPALPINRCDRCRRRLFDGFLFGVIKCPHCNRLLELVDKKAEEEYHAAKLNGRL